MNIEKNVYELKYISTFQFHVLEYELWMILVCLTENNVGM